MKIAIFGLNYAPELTGVGKYTGELVEFLAEQGHEVMVICSPPYYPAWRRADGYSRWRYQTESQGSVTVYRCPLYIPSRPSAVRRVLHLASFGWSAFVRGISISRQRPDVVLAIQPTLFAAPAALFCAALSRSPRALHIQDFELDALVGLGFLDAPVLGRLAAAIERWLMRHFDRISTISRSMLEVAGTKGVPPERLSLLPNWVDQARLVPGDVDPDLLERLGVPPQSRVVLYSGNIGAKQGLENLLAVSRRMRDEPSIHFLLVGEGAGLSALKDLAEENELANVTFSPLLPRDQLSALLNSADVHVVCQRRGAADIVLPSKLTGILAVGGHCVVTADPGTELGIIEAENPGIYELVEPESVEVLEAGIKKLLAEDTRVVNSVARAYAERHLSKGQVLAQFNNHLVAMAEQGQVE